MKRSVLISILLCISIYLHSQNIIRYTYDNAGNRTKREIVLTKSYSTSDEEEKIESYSDRLKTHQIVILPNPTKGNINVRISNIDSQTNGNISIYTTNGVQIAKAEINSENNPFDLSSQPNGMYLMHITIDEETTTWKIIKK